MKISILGVGYVGLVSGACFAELGWNVDSVDIDEEKIARLKLGDLPIFEPGLDEIVQRNVSNGRLKFGTDVASAVADADAVFIAVGTPPLEDGRADTTAVAAAAREIAPHLSGYTVVVIKSTVPVGTGTYVTRLIREVNPTAQVSVASNPEFLREGSAIRDFLQPERIVVGCVDTGAREVMRALYAPLELRDVPLILTDRATAELIKYSANSFLAAKVAFINEMADLCDSIGANVDDLARAIGLDSRIGPSFLKPGPGYGGSCFPKDTLALAAQAQEADCPVRIVEAVVASNAHHIRRLVGKIERDCAAGWGRMGYEDTTLWGKKLAVLGLAFKSNTDDIRYAASVVILPQLEKQGVRLQAYDPAAMDNAKEVMPGIDYRTSVEDVLEGADAALILTEWPQFHGISWATLKDRMASPVVVDLRNLYSPKDAADAGIAYYSLGRPDHAPSISKVVKLAGVAKDAAKAV